MTSIGDLVFVAGIFVGPPFVLITCVLLLVTRQPRWVAATAIASAVVSATAFVAYWYSWGRAFDYGDANRSVPPALDQASDIAIAVSLMSSLLVAALGVSRLFVAHNDRPRSEWVPTV